MVVRGTAGWADHLAASFARPGRRRSRNAGRLDCTSHDIVGTSTKGVTIGRTEKSFFQASTICRPSLPCTKQGRETERHTLRPGMPAGGRSAQRGHSGERKRRGEDACIRRDIKRGSTFCFWTSCSTRYRSAALEDLAEERVDWDQEARRVLRAL